VLINGQWHAQGLRGVLYKGCRRGFITWSNYRTFPSVRHWYSRAAATRVDGAYVDDGASARRCVGRLECRWPAQPGDEATKRCSALTMSEFTDVVGLSVLVRRAGAYGCGEAVPRGVAEEAVEPGARNSQ